MIPADRICIDGNEAWLIVDEVLPTGLDAMVANAFDRPCETCGTGYGLHRAPFNCPDCIVGRHTFDLEVECGACRDHVVVANAMRYRVSIVPGMVLPICGEREWAEYEVSGPPAIVKFGDTFIHEREGADRSHRINLPPAAAPGMYAVKLTVAA